MSENSSTQAYIPQVAADRKPQVGQEFHTIDEAFAFYNSYARECGFSARMSNSKRSKKTNEVVWKVFVCFKQGETDDTYQKKWKETVHRSGERQRGVTRIGCKAKLSIVKRQTGSDWIVSNFVECHNHALSTPSKVHLLRSHRNVSTAKRVLTQQLSEANIPTCQQIRIMEIESTGPQNIGCTEGDIRNYERDLKEEQKIIDAETLIEFFSSEKEKNLGFYFDFETDGENKLTRCFWADHVARRSYGFFGDIVVFDTTYNTNKYGMIFAPLVGVNHHGQTTIFGCGFLSDEKTDSFIWLINKWLDAMPNGAPKMIITDQDPAMTKAIAQILPNTVHRYCIWHILNKFSININQIILRDHYHLFKNVIFNSETIEEFDAGWSELLRITNLENDPWLNQLYGIRSKWIPAYVNHIFSAGISSSQRAESAHAFFKRYISRKNSLMDFITRFNRAVSHQRYEELVADHIDINEQPKVKSSWPMETQMAKVYTKKIFTSFQVDVFDSLAYMVNSIFEDEDVVRYNVQKVDGNSATRCRTLTYKKKFDFVSCSCRQFEFKGFPCKHMLAFFRFKQIFNLQSQYILSRWTKGAKVGGVWDNQGEEINDVHDQSLITRHARLSHLVSSLVDDASLTDEGTNLILNEVKNLQNKIREINSTVCGAQISSKRKSSGISNPSIVRAKGCGKRIKSAKEIAILKARLCRGCGLRGQSHDKRNCPKLLERSNVDNTDKSSDDLHEEEEDLASTIGATTMMNNNLF